MAIAMTPSENASSRALLTEPAGPLLVGRHEARAEREHRDLRAALEERHLAEAELPREVLELGRDRLLVGPQPLGDLVVGQRAQPVAVAEQRRAQLAQDLLLLH